MGDGGANQNDYYGLASASFDPYKYAVSLKSQAFHCQTSQESEGRGIEDLFALRREQATDLALMIASNLGLVDKTHQENVLAIQEDLMSVHGLIERLPMDKKYFFGKERVDFESRKLDLLKELRQEKNSRNQAAAMLLRELREAVLVIQKERRKSGILGLENLVDKDARPQS